MLSKVRSEKESIGIDKLNLKKVKLELSSFEKEINGYILPVYIYTKLLCARHTMLKMRELREDFLGFKLCSIDSKISLGKG